MTAVEDAWACYSDAANWGVNSVGNPSIELEGRAVTVFRGASGWGWIIRPLEDEPLAWALRDNLPAAEQAKAEAWGALCVFLQAGLVKPGDIVGLYGRLVIEGGARADDPHLAALREAMTPDEIVRAKASIGAELLRRAPAERPN
jgi:hypothetical protein